MRHKPTYEELVKKVGRLEKEVIHCRQLEKDAGRSAMEKAEGILRVMFDATHDNALLLELDGTVLAINAAAAHGLGKEPSDIVGKNIYDLLPEKIATVRKEQCLKAALKKQPVRFSEKTHETFFNWNIYPVFSENDHGVKLAAFGQDVTEQKRAEKILRERDVQYRRIVNAATDSFLIFDLDGRIVEANPAACHMYGYAHDELVGLSGQDTVHPDFYHIFDEFKRNVQKNGSFEAESMDIRKDGAPFHVSVSGSLFVHKGNPHLLAVIRDISEKKRQMEQLQQARKMDALGTLAGGIAHQFNNALTAITGNIGLLEMDLPGDQRFSRNIADMKTSAHRMAHLTSQLLAYARGGRYHLQTTPIRDFLEATLSLIEHTLKPSVRLETDLPPNLMQVKADRTQMQMVISAIVANANEAIEEKGRIRISAENVEMDALSREESMKPGPYVQLTISDNGKGMDEETRSRIFEPFFTTHFIGRGLGMAAVYGIVTNHDGSIWVESQRGEGTRVHMILPAIQVETVAAKTSGKTQAEAPVRGEGTILVIEDEPDVMEITRETLKRLGYVVLEAVTGREAVQKAISYEGTIDMALLDIKLPDMSGNQLYPLIMNARPDLKVVVFSGYALDGPAREILDAGAEGFVQKPFSIAGLSQKLKEVLLKSSC